MNGLPNIAIPIMSAASVQVRCSYLVEQANLLAASGNSIWKELPRSVALELAVELGRVHRNALGILAWFGDNQVQRPDEDALYDQLETYLGEAERLIETLKKASL